MSKTLAELLAMYDADAPLEEAYTIPAPWYLDARVEQAEREHVFGRDWIAVGRMDQVAEEGQFFTVELAGEPLVIVRGSDSVLRAFYNVCRHHAAAVANVPCGTVQHLRCHYHGWTYGLDGLLIGAPHMEQPDFSRADACQLVRDGLSSPPRLAAPALRAETRSCERFCF